MADDPDDLRETARERIRARQLPDRRPAVTWGGGGNGTPCPVCDEEVRSDDAEVEFELGAATYRMHARCYRAWECALHEETPAQLPDAIGRAIMASGESEAGPRRRG